MKRNEYNDCEYCINNKLCIGVIVLSLILVKVTNGTNGILSNAESVSGCAVSVWWKGEAELI